jgi:hypothetical protein
LFSPQPSSRPLSASAPITLRAPSSADVERGVEAAKEMPLVGLVIAENPPLEEKLRAVIADELKKSRPGAVPGSRFGVEVRQRYIIPTLLAADDDSALKATGGMEVLAKYLQTKDPDLCRELGLAGLHNANKLDADGKVLLKQALALQEQAYRNGKAGSPKTPLKTEEIGRVLGEAGYTDKDLEQLSTFRETVDGRRMRRDRQAIRRTPRPADRARRHIGAEASDGRAIESRGFVRR